MVSENKRQSERVHVKLRVGVRGVDTAGAAFVEQAQTIQVSRGGAVIRLNRELVKGARLVLSRPDAAGKPEEASARIVDRVGGDADGARYSMAFEEPGMEFWGIAFPEPGGNTLAMVRLLMECVRCGGREVACLDEKQLEDFEAMRTVARACQSCGAPTLWKQAPEEISDAERPAASGGATRVHEPRKKRIPSHVNVCVRRPGFADEIAVCENLSVGGLCFRSRKIFAKGERVEVAVPYVKGVSNIFVPARIVHITEVPLAGVFRHGAAYVALTDEDAEDSDVPKD